MMVEPLQSLCLLGEALMEGQHQRQTSLRTAVAHLEVQSPVGFAMEVVHLEEQSPDAAAWCRVQKAGPRAAHIPL